MKDRRSQTSRQNLGDHIPEALSPRGSVVITAKIPRELADKINEARGDQTMSEYVRGILHWWHEKKEKA